MYSLDDEDGRREFEEEDAIFGRIDDGLCSDNEDTRRIAIVRIWQWRLECYAANLLSLLSTERSEDNLRHAVRALEVLGIRQALAPLLTIAHVRLEDDRGSLLLGEIAKYIGTLHLKEGRHLLDLLKDNPTEWVRQNVNRALKRLDE